MKKNQLFSIKSTGVRALVLGGACFLFACKGEESSFVPEQQSQDRVIKTQAVTRLWTGTANQAWSNVFQNFNTEDNGGTTPTLTTVDDATKGKVWKIYKPSGAKRAEASRAKGYNQQEGETIDLNYSWKYSTVQDEGSNEFTVFQWKTDATGSDVDRQNYPFNITYKSGKIYLNTFGPGTPDWTNGSVSGRKNTIWSGSVTEGQWVSIGLRIKVSKYTGTTTSQKGSIQLWINGTQQTFTTQNSTSNYDISLSGDSKTAYHRTNDGTVTYPKWGVYNEASRPFDVYVWLHNMKIDRL